MKIRTVFHCDMDAFFASIEQRNNPRYKGKPVIVGGKVGSRGVVSAASYEARTFGIHSAMPINEAYHRCPKGIFIQPDMLAYTDESSMIMKIFNRFTPVVEQISVDEAFLDMTGTNRLYGNVKATALQLKKTIFDERKLTASIGIAPNKFLAKIASDIDKPNGITITPNTPKKIIAWLAQLPIKRMWGVGEKTASILNSYDIKTIDHLQIKTLSWLEMHLGKQGSSLYYLSRGIDDRTIKNCRQGVKSISHEHTFESDSYDHIKWKQTLLKLARYVARRCRKKKLKGQTIFLTYRKSDFSRHSRQITLRQPTDLAMDIYNQVTILLEKEWGNLEALRLIGLGITNFTNIIQTDLFTSQENKHESSEKAMDIIANKFGNNAIFRGGESAERTNRTLS